MSLTTIRDLRARRVGTWECADLQAKLIVLRPNVSDSLAYNRLASSPDELTLPLLAEVVTGLVLKVERVQRGDRVVESIGPAEFVEVLTIEELAALSTWILKGDATPPSSAG